MKTHLLAIFFSCLSLFCQAQQHVLDWSRKIGGLYWDEGSRLDVDKHGNSYSTGFFTGSVSFQTGSSVVTLTSVGLADCYVAKHDDGGNIIWAKRIGGGSENINGIAVDTLGNSYICGNTLGATDLDPGPATFTVPVNGQNDMFLVKLDPLGNKLWALQWGGTGQDVAREVAVDRYGDVFVTGYFGSTVDFDPGLSTFTMAATSSTTSMNIDGFVAKFGSAGNFVWAKGFNGPGDTEPEDIIVDTLGYVYSTGSIYGISDFNPGSGTFTLGSGNTSAAYVSKLDANGNFVWAAGLNGNYVRGMAISLDNNGDVLTTGNYNFFADFDPGPNTYTLGNNGDAIYVSKLSQNGLFIWAKQFESSSNGNSGYGITSDSIGNVYISGAFLDTVDFDPGPATYTLQSKNISQGQPDAFIAKLNSAGNFGWLRQIGGDSWDGAFRLKENKGSLYITGSFHTMADFDQSPASYTINSFGGYDAFVMKLSPCNTPGSPANATGGPNQVICSGLSATISASTNTGTILWYSTNSSTTNIGTGNTLITPSLSAGVYTFYATVQTCTISLSRTPITVTVNLSPVISVNSGSICSGGSFTFNPSGASSYNFQGGSAVVAPLATSVFTVTGTATNSCTSLPVAGTVQVLPLPSTTISASHNPVCIGETLTLTASGADLFQWKGGQTAAEQQDSPGKDSVYVLTGTSVAGCVKTVSLSVTVDACVGEKAKKLPEGKANIYPNPFTNIVTVTGISAGLSVQVFDACGKLVRKFVSSGDKTEIDLSGLSNGLYLVRINGSTLRVVKED